MDAHTPADWVFHHADEGVDTPALMFADGAVTYGQVADEVLRRADTLRDVDRGAVVPVRVRHDLASIVDVLAHQRTGACPLPYVEDRPTGASAQTTAVACFATSGSTGAPKLVPLTMANVRSAVRASRLRLGTGMADRWLLSLPLNHVGGMSVLWRSFEAGGTAVVVPFGPTVVDAVARFEPTVASWVPTMVHRLVPSHPDALARIGLNLVGGASLGASLRSRIAEAGIDVTPTYGMTEAASQVATHRPGSEDALDGTAGEPLEGVSVTIVDPDDEGIGRIAVEGPQVFGGYLGDEPRTAPFVSNDVGQLTDQGKVRVMGRIDDVVVTGGENVSLGTVSEALYATDLVSDAAVVAIDDAEWGVAVCALVVSDAAPEAIMEHVRSMHPPHVVPKRVVVTDAIPLLPNGKHDMDAVRAVFGSK